MKIANREINTNQPPYIVAELSGNHEGSIGVAYDMMIAAADCGADAVKIQCYTADSLTFKGEGDDFKIMQGPWKGKTLYDLYKSAETPPSMVRDLFRFAQANKITLFSSVFDHDGVDLVVSLGAPAIKIASFELVDTPLIQYAASTKLPLIISTGMGSNSEIIDAVNAFRKGCNDPTNLGLLHCISNYPASASEANLPVLGPLSNISDGNHVVGFSDHTLGYGSAAGAVAFGASIIEKHFILGRHRGGPDAAFSLEPLEFNNLVKVCRETWEAIQTVQSRSQQRQYLKYRKSVYVVHDLVAGESFSKDNCRVLRPASGLPPSLYQTILAGVATCDLKAGTPLKAENVSSLC